MLYTLKTLFLGQYTYQIIATVVAVLVFVVLRFVLRSIIKNFGKKAFFTDGRTNLVMKYTDYLINTLAVISLVAIWGVEGKQLVLVISSILTIIGVAFFAQWSILSNVTAGIILFFSFPFKIGDRIRIRSEERRVGKEIEDIKSFYTLLKTAEGEEIAFPNNLLLQKGIVIVPQQQENTQDFTD